MNLYEFAKEVHALAVEKGFYDPEPSDAELIAAIHSEISEAFEEWRAGRPMVWHACVLDLMCDGNECSDGFDPNEECKYRDPKPHGIAVELIDVMLRVLDTAAAWGEMLYYYEALDIERIHWNAYIDREIKDLFIPELLSYLHRIITDIDIDHANGDDLGNVYGMCYPISLIFCWLRAQGLDPEALLLEKHAYNRTRPYRHGGKRV